MKLALIIIGALAGFGYAIKREIIARQKEARGEYVDNPKPYIFVIFILLNMVCGGFAGWLIYLLLK